MVQQITRPGRVLRDSVNRGPGLRRHGPIVPTAGAATPSCLLEHLDETPLMRKARCVATCDTDEHARPGELRNASVLVRSNPDRGHWPDCQIAPQVRRGAMHTVVNGRVMVREGGICSLGLEPLLEHHNRLARLLAM